jgi:hypothetical protein
MTETVAVLFARADSSYKALVGTGLTRHAGHSTRQSGDDRHPRPEGLDGVLGRTEEDGADVLEAEYPQPMPTCLPEVRHPQPIGHLYRHGTKATTYVDIPMRGKPAKLRAKVQRYRCTSCKETFLQPLGGILEGRRMTERCATYIKAHSLRDTFTRIAENVGCDDKTVRTLGAEYMAELEASHRPEMPDWLGLDETQIDGKMRCVITDVGERRVIDMLPDRDKATLAGWLHRFKDRHWVKGIAIDMWRPYRDVSHMMFPGKPVVIDKFHVVRTASYCMERVRIRLQKAQEAGRPEGLAALQGDAEHAVRQAVGEAAVQRGHVAGQRARAGLRVPAEGGVLRHLRHAQGAGRGGLRRLPGDRAGQSEGGLQGAPDRHEELADGDSGVLRQPHHQRLHRGAERGRQDHQPAGPGVHLRGAARPAPVRQGAAEPWRLATVYPANTTQLQLLKREQGNRCQSCGCELGRSKDDKANVVVLVRGNTRRQQLICGACNVGFHTEALNHREARSTQKSG